MHVLTTVEKTHEAAIALEDLMAFYECSMTRDEFDFLWVDYIEDIPPDDVPLSDEVWPRVQELRRLRIAGDETMRLETLRKKYFSEKEPKAVRRAS
jgi:hypothetical protein